jgi:hypothetical protein
MTVALMAKRRVEMTVERRVALKAWMTVETTALKAWMTVEMTVARIVVVL